jgi:tetratricopeptide (TPR) repeat protein
LGLALAAPSAAAEARPHGSTPAEGLFLEGRALYDAGRFEEALRKLAESRRLEPRVGTEGLLASCHEQLGQLATAYRHYINAARLARAESDPRARFAVERAAALEPRVPRLRIRAARPAPGLWITRDGARVPAAELDRDLLIDPGLASIVAGAPGRHAFRASIRLDPGARVVVDVPELVPVEKATAEERAAPAGRALGLTAGALGVMGVGVGAGFGVAALVKQGASDELCDAHDRCSPAGGALRDEARIAANIATTGFVIGVVGLGTGAAILLLVPEPAAPAKGARILPLAGPAIAGAALHGRF